MESLPIYSIAAFTFEPLAASFCPPYPMHQRPTHPRLHVRDVRDALIILEAVRLGILKQVTRRLNDAERSMYVRSGSVFVWEESEDDAGIKRWTDGCMWSQSRMREPFLFYEEKVQDDRTGNATSKNRSQSIGESSSSSLSPLTPALSPTRGGPSSHSHQSSPSHHGSVPQAYSNAVHSPFGDGATGGPGLVKQAYSAYVTAPGTSIRKKFHLTAYFTYADLPNLPTLESEPMLWNIVIPQGVYRSGKSRTSGRNLANAAEPARPRKVVTHGTGDSSPSPTSSPSSIGHSPLAHWPGARRGSGSYFDPSTSDSAYASVTHTSSYASTSLAAGASSSSRMTSPHLEAFASIPRLPPVSSLALEPSGNCRGRNSEDNRVISMLNSRGIP